MLSLRAGSLIILQASSLAGIAGAQDTTISTYDVKFVCGTRGVIAVRGGSPFETVAPGRYYSAINLLNPSRDWDTVLTTVAATAIQPQPGPMLPGPHSVLPPGTALEIDCADILTGTRPPPFLKGFLRISATSPLTVTAVYTAANQAGVVSIDVDRVSNADAARCPDLTYGRVDRPTVDPTTQHTIVKFVVVNVGNVGAGAFDVRVEDPNRAPNPDRIAQTTVSGLGPGGFSLITLELPYAISGSRNFAALVLQIDPKNMIPECREDNNTRTIGAP